MVARRPATLRYRRVSRTHERTNATLYCGHGSGLVGECKGKGRRAKQSWQLVASRSRRNASKSRVGARSLAETGGTSTSSQHELERCSAFTRMFNNRTSSIRTAGEWDMCIWRSRIEFRASELSFNPVGDNRLA